MCGRASMIALGRVVCDGGFEARLCEGVLRVRKPQGWLMELVVQRYSVRVLLGIGGQRSDLCRDECSVWSLGRCLALLHKYDDRYCTVQGLCGLVYDVQVL